MSNDQSTLSHACNQDALAEHLRVDRRTVPVIAERHKLVPIGTMYPWPRIWLQLHRIEPPPEDLWPALQAPLMKPEEVAARCGYRQVASFDAARRADRIKMPPGLIILGDRTRRWRPAEFEPWLSGGAPPRLVPVCDGDADGAGRSTDDIFVRIAASGA